MPFRLQLEEETEGGMFVQTSHEVALTLAKGGVGMKWQMFKLAYDDVEEHIVEVVGIDVVCDLGDGLSAYVVAKADGEEELDEVDVACEVASGTAKPKEEAKKVEKVGASKNWFSQP